MLTLLKDNRFCRVSDVHAINTNLLIFPMKIENFIRIIGNFFKYLTQKKSAKMLLNYYFIAQSYNVDCIKEME